MNRGWQKDSTIRSLAVTATLPPAMVEETAWDILLAIYPNNGLSLEKLAPVASVNPIVIGGWLDWLEGRALITGTRDGLTGEVRAALTPGGRELLDRYLSASIDLEARTH